MLTILVDALIGSLISTVSAQTIASIDKGSEKSGNPENSSLQNYARLSSLPDKARQKAFIDLRLTAKRHYSDSI